MHFEKVKEKKNGIQDFVFIIMCVCVCVHFTHGRVNVNLFYRMQYVGAIMSNFALTVLKVN